MIVLEYAPSYGIELVSARRFTDEEKTRYAEWFAETGFVGTGDCIELNKLTFQDLPRRPSDGSFCGCNNSAWIVSEDEAEMYKKLNAERLDEADRIQAEEDAEASAMKQAHEQARRDCLAQFDSWNVSDIKKRNGDSFVEHTFVLHGKELCFIERNIFDFGTVINPTNIKGGALLRRDDKEGWVWDTGDSLIALGADEVTCVQAIHRFGKFAKMPIRM